MNVVFYSFNDWKIKCGMNLWYLCQFHQYRYIRRLLSNHSTTGFFFTNIVAAFNVSRLNSIHNNTTIVLCDANLINNFQLAFSLKIHTRIESLDNTKNKSNTNRISSSFWGAHKINHHSHGYFERPRYNDAW